MTYRNHLAMFVGILLVQSSVSLAQPAPPKSDAAQVTFGQQPASVGDQVTQTVGVDLQVHTTITQAGQQANESQTSMQRRQERLVEVLEVAKGNVCKAKVTYPVSRMFASGTTHEITQPVEKKSYLVTRKGKKLLVTDTEGVIPSQEEYKIVSTSMQNLGLPNPLIKFLVGRTVRVGEKLSLPQTVAEEVFGFGDQFSQVKQFELELQSLQEIDGQPCAVFFASVSAVGESASPVLIRAFGKFIVQTQTCRTVRTDLKGPLTLSTVERTAAGNFQYSARGSMHVAVQAKYGYARQ